MGGRHRVRARRSWWLPAVGATTVVVAGAAIYGTVVLPSTAEPRLPSDPAGDVSGVFDRTTTVRQVVDGDSFVIDGGATVRVLAADSCEGRTDAGPAARSDAEAVLAGRTITLRREPAGTNDADRDGRLLRYVEVPGVGDLGSYMVARPHTAVYRGFNDASPAYLDRLRALDRDGRRCVDELPPPGTQPRVRYADCSAARAGGLGALYVGDPAYSRELDGNDDGVACE